MNSEDSAAEEGYGESYWKNYCKIKYNKKMHMYQVRELLFRGSNNLGPDTGSNYILEVSKNQEEPGCSFDNSCHCTIAWKSITKVLIQSVMMYFRTHFNAQNENLNISLFGQKLISRISPFRENRV